VLGGVAEDVNARLREPFQIWIALADLPYVQSIRDAFGLTAIDDLGKHLPDRLMSPESSTRTVRDLSPWAALSIKFAGLLTALGGAVTGLILLDNSWLQLLIAGALGVIFTQFACLGHEASHRQVLASRHPTTVSASEGFRGPAMCAVVRNFAETYATGRGLCAA